jgi:hypothetical protein
VSGCPALEMQPQIKRLRLQADVIFSQLRGMKRPLESGINHHGIRSIEHLKPLRVWVLPILRVRFDDTFVYFCARIHIRRGSAARLHPFQQGRVPVLAVVSQSWFEMRQHLGPVIVRTPAQHAVTA